MFGIFVLILYSDGVHTAFDMSCDCGKREMNEIAKKDCEESARLQPQDQGWTHGKFFITSINGTNETKYGHITTPTKSHYNFLRISLLEGSQG